MCRVDGVEGVRGMCGVEGCIGGGLIFYVNANNPECPIIIITGRLR